jgi:hypothetical protein
MGEVRKMTLEEFRAEVERQQAAGTEAVDIKFVCPMCKVPQSGRDLIAAGAGVDFGEVNKYLAFSCVGRFTGAPAPRAEPDGQPCNWTLGGLFQTHRLVVVMPDGYHRPTFEFAEEAGS